jgi:hypothetical protein
MAQGSSRGIRDSPSSISRPAGNRPALLRRLRRFFAKECDNGNENRRYCSWRVQMDELMTLIGGLLFFFFIVFVLIVVLIVWGVRKAMAKAKTIGKAPEYERIETEGDIAEDHVIAVLKKYTHRYGVDDLARSGISALESVAHKRESFFAALDAKFQKNTISWDRFAVGADTAFGAIERSTAQLANAIQAFDSDEYRRLERLAGSAGANSPSIDAVQQERLGMFRGRLDGMRTIVADNERMLLELDKLEAELGKLESDEREDRGEDILQEIRTLTEEMKYYQ